ncbi:alpha-crystallin B chain-like [Physella acuta]|uniref:alpha-crystallin B chain-like n=1 Tax=Physella acuta TaxID=109671 RepID=UPI0027DD1B7A|nr:alpha-crystallin B chain-like [Physella acuta]
MSVQRQVPVSMEPSRPDVFDSFFPSFRDAQFPGSSLSGSTFPRENAFYAPRETYVRDPMRDTAVYQANPMPVSALPLTRGFFNPERQLASMDNELQRMSSEMRRMFSEIQHLMPGDANPEGWRVKENFFLDNPVYHDVSSGHNVFRLQFDVRQFRPEEIFVKTLGNQLTIHAKHDESTDGKSLHKEYHRQYVLPKELNPETLTSKLSRDGILTIEAPLPITDGHKDKLIPIKHE